MQICFENVSLAFKYAIVWLFLIDTATRQWLFVPFYFKLVMFQSTRRAFCQKCDSLNRSNKQNAETFYPTTFDVLTPHWTNLSGGFFFFFGELICCAVLHKSRIHYPHSVIVLNCRMSPGSNRLLNGSICCLKITLEHLGTSAQIPWWSEWTGGVPVSRSCLTTAGPGL